jgi:hypothetical protein
MPQRAWHLARHHQVQFLDLRFVPVGKISNAGDGMNCQPKRLCYVGDAERATDQIRCVILAAFKEYAVDITIDPSPCGELRIRHRVRDSIVHTRILFETKY